jgi:ribosomal protein S7
MSRKAVGDLDGRFVGLLMKDGAGTRAKRILRAAMDEVRRKIRSAATANRILDIAVENATPSIWIKTARVWDKSFKVPMTLTNGQAVAIAIRVILDVARCEPGRTMKRRLARAILAAYRGDVNPHARWRTSLADAPRRIDRSAE